MVAGKSPQGDLAAALPLDEAIGAGADRLAAPRFLDQSTIGKNGGGDDRNLAQRVEDLGLSTPQVEMDRLVPF